MLSCCQCFFGLFFFGGGGYSTTWTANEALLMLTVLPLNCFKYIYMDKSSARVWVLKPRLYLISLGLSPCTQGGQLLSTIKVNVQQYLLVMLLLRSSDSVMRPWSGFCRRWNIGLWYNKCWSHGTRVWLQQTLGDHWINIYNFYIYFYQCDK